MNNHYWISKHHLRYANNSNSNVGNAKLQFIFLIAETPPDLLLNFVVDPISTPLLIAFMLSATTVSTHVVVIPTLSDRGIPIPACYLRVSTTIASNTIGEIVLT
jgi:hypothetical protein